MWLAGMVQGLSGDIGKWRNFKHKCNIYRRASYVRMYACVHTQEAQDRYKRKTDGSDGRKEKRKGSI
jgi:hypothetical protein